MEEREGINWVELERSSQSDAAESETALSFRAQQLETRDMP